MRPDDNQQSGRVGTPQTTARSSSVHTPPPRNPQYRQQEAAANIIRAQLDSIYEGKEPTVVDDTPALQPTSSQLPQTPLNDAAPRDVARSTVDEPENPYERTHSSQPTIREEQWKTYHSAWQDYYKRYYEGYYTQQVATAKRSLEHAQRSVEPYSSQPTPQHAHPSLGSENTAPVENGPMTRNQAMKRLRSKLLDQVETSAKKVRKSRHFIPIIAALGVLLIFGFLQYNQILIANVKAYITPGNIDPQNIIVDPQSTVAVDNKPRLIIPKINVDTPVFYDISTDKKSQDKAMENGVAHFPIANANSHPGEVGNTVLSGHSSNDVFAPGDYKFIFMQLDKLDVGDTIYANYKGTRYTYIVTKKKEVSPTNVKALTYTTDKPEMTLITCTPLGTALRRLLITAEQVYPTTKKAAPSSSSSDNDPSAMPSQGEPSVLERIFS